MQNPTNMPKLHEILSNRIAVNILKLLYEQEMGGKVGEKKTYVAKLSQLQSLLVFVEPPLVAVALLRNAELITTETITGVMGVQHLSPHVSLASSPEEPSQPAFPYQDTLLSITTKGKEFIESIDHLIEIYTGEMPQKNRKRFFISLELSRDEKRILLVLCKLVRQGGVKQPTITLLTQALFPSQPLAKKRGFVERLVNKLEQLNMLHQKKDKKGLYLLVTPKGYDAVANEYAKGIEL